MKITTFVNERELNNLTPDVDYRVNGDDNMVLLQPVTVVIDNKPVGFGVGHKWNGCTIPKQVWWLLGSSTNPKFALASLVHDGLYDWLYDRDIADMAFRMLLRRAGVGAERAAVMWVGVRVGGFAYYQAYTRGGTFWKLIRNNIYNKRAV